MSEEAARRRAVPSRRRRILKTVGIVATVLAVLVASFLVYAVKRFEGNITAIDPTKQLGTDRPAPVRVQGPKRPMNVLVMGSDDRKGTNIGGETPGLSDTAILLHLSADRTRAYGVSIPRDLMVQRPECIAKDGKTKIPGGLLQFNAAFAAGGPTCTVRTVEKLTNVRIDHFVVVNFRGFKDMVDAVRGVTVCVPQKVNDNVGHIYLPKGTYKVTGNQALDYVRVRHGLGAPNGDIGRMKRQQAFISSMIAKVVSAGTLANPVRLYKFLDAATKSLTTDAAFAHLKALASLGSSLKNIGLNKIQFVTVPNEPWTQDPNRLQLAAGADALWRKIKYDKPLGRLGSGAVSPGTGTPGAKPSPSQSTGPSTSPSPSGGAAEAQRKREAKEAGLCA